jgi:molybdate transport system regulatory protein
MEQVATRALLHLHKGPLARVGPERIRLLEAIAEHGSITAASKAVGLSYKGAWDAVQALNNLFERPLIAAHTGGRGGGQAVVTPAGAAVLRAYKQVEAELSNIVDRLEAVLAQADAPLDQLIWSLGMKTSARNALRGVVESVVPGAVNSEVRLRVAEGIEVVSVITRESVEELALAPGREAIALIKASFVILAPAGDVLRTSARNRFEGEVIRHETGAVNDEVVLDLGAGKTIAATLTRESAGELGLRVGERAQALVKASHVILAVD